MAMIREDFGNVPQPGDKMVIISRVVGKDKAVGTIVTVDYIEDLNSRNDCEVYVLEEKDNYYARGQLEFEAIYNSPLMKAMNEVK